MTGTTRLCVVLSWESLADPAVTTGGLDRVVVLGTSGSGKSTLARLLAAHAGLEYVLDAINHGPNWTSMPVDEF